MKQKSVTKSDKYAVPQAAMLNFLGLLNHVSVSPEVLEFCTPGHKAGRGFKPLLAAEPASLPVTLPEEVGHDA